MKKIKQKKLKKGFSLVEVLFALMIMVLAITGVIFLLTNSGKSIQDSKNQIVAAQLAQEGVELVRNLKENNNLGTDFNEPGTAFGRADYLSANFVTVTNADQSYRLYTSNGTNRFFSHSASGTPSKFYRKICLVVAGSVAANNRVITANVFVTWNSGFSFTDCDVSKCALGNKCVSAVSVMPDLPN